MLRLAWMTAGQQQEEEEEEGSRRSRTWWGWPEDYRQLQNSAYYLLIVICQHCCCWIEMLSCVFSLSVRPSVCPAAFRPVLQDYKDYKDSRCSVSAMQP